MKQIGLVLATLMLAPIFASARAADLVLRVVEKQPPSEVSDTVKQTLQSKAVQLLDGDKAVYQFWFRTEIPVQSKLESPSKALSSLAEITLLGVVTVGEGRRDYKDNEIAPGTYTLRFGLQPQDGDHLGTSEFPFFAVLIPSKSDPAPPALKTYKSMVKASGRGTASGHPIVLSLRPVPSGAESAPKLVAPAPGHKAIQLNLTAKAADASQTIDLPVELVYEGKFKS